MGGIVISSALAGISIPACTDVQVAGGYQYDDDNDDDDDDDGVDVDMDDGDDGGADDDGHAYDAMMMVIVNMTMIMMAQMMTAMMTIRVTSKRRRRRTMSILLTIVASMTTTVFWRIGILFGRGCPYTIMRPFRPNFLVSKRGPCSARIRGLGEKIGLQARSPHAEPAKHPTLRSRNHLTQQSSKNCECIGIR